MTSLGRIEPPERILPKAVKCPKCGAGKDKRINPGGFGPDLGVILCGVCGYEVKE